MKIINTVNAPKAIGPYTQAILVNNTLYVSGQLPVELESGTKLDDVYAATLKCLSYILEIVSAAGMTKTNIVKCNVYLKDLDDFAIMNKAYGEFFSDHKPARVAIEVSKLPKDVVVEIDCIAAI
ncbi:MAG: Enamine/imine deaminase [Tenericutes bacterium ADurb.Bin087]|nr:MAG: Enamine/imine deaminase [Tenericutes bacterium ADurb.Bin087]